MRSWLAALALVASAVAVTAADYRTIQGEIAAPACAAAEVPEVASESPAARTMRCARQGVALVIETPDGPFAITGDYTANRNAKLLDFVAQPVEAKGQVSELDGQLSINVAAMIVRKP